MKFTKYAKYLGVAALAIGIATGCQSSGDMDESSASNDTQAIQQIISDAKAELDIAKQGEYAWRDTGKFIKKAEKALAAGDTKKAKTLATKALEQSKLAKMQREEQDAAIKARFN